MYLESDAFAVVFDPQKATTTDIMDKIQVLGYRPREGDLPGTDGPEPDSTRSIPEPLAELLADGSGDAGTLFFVDFYAEWCAPCKKLEASVLSTDTIKEALSRFGVIKVDTDKFPKAAEYYRVKALPTLLVIDRTGAEKYRHLGPITVERLRADLALLTDTEQ